MIACKPCWLARSASSACRIFGSLPVINERLELIEHIGQLVHGLAYLDLAAGRPVPELRQLRQPLPCRRHSLNEGSFLNPLLPSHGSDDSRDTYSDPGLFSFL